MHRRAHTHTQNWSYGVVSRYWISSNFSLIRIKMPCKALIKNSAITWHHDGTISSSLPDAIRLASHT